MSFATEDLTIPILTIFCDVQNDFHDAVINDTRIGQLDRVGEDYMRQVYKKTRADVIKKKDKNRYLVKRSEITDKRSGLILRLKEARKLARSTGTSYRKLSILQ